MSQALLAMMGAGSLAVPTYVDDVFSAYTYTGNGSGATVNNGLDLSTKGGMVWIKSRGNAVAPAITDTAIGGGYWLDSTSTAAKAAQPTISFASDGFSHSTSNTLVGASGYTYCSWSFRKAARFFDVVTYTGDGVGARTVAHSLGVAPGLVITKSTSATGQWVCYARTGATSWVIPNSAGTSTFGLAQTNGGYNYSDATPYFTNSIFSPSALGYTADSNASGVTYVAYLFAHDTGADGLVQCGSFTTDGSGGATVNHGWSAGVQFALVKCSSTTGDWEMYDTARTSGWTGSDARLRANLSNAEDSVTRLSASGTSVTFAGLSNSATYIYMFITAP